MALTVVISNGDRVIYRDPTYHAALLAQQAARDAMRRLPDSDEIILEDEIETELTDEDEIDIDLEVL